jgi:hypothetical protein
MPIDVPNIQPTNFGYQFGVPGVENAQRYATIGNLNADAALRQQQLAQSQYGMQQQQQADQRAAQVRKVIADQTQAQQNQPTPQDPNVALNNTYNAIAQVDPQAAEQYRQSAAVNQFYQARAQDFAAQGQERTQALVTQHQNEILQHTNAVSGLAHSLLNTTLDNAGTYVSGYNPNGTSIHTSDPTSNNYQGVEYFPKLSTPQQVADTRQHVASLIAAAQMGKVDDAMTIPPIEQYDANPQQYMQNLYNEEKGWYQINQNAPGTIKTNIEQQKANTEQQYKNQQLGIEQGKLNLERQKELDKTGGTGSSEPVYPGVDLGTVKIPPSMRSPAGQNMQLLNGYADALDLMKSGNVNSYQLDAIKSKLAGFEAPPTILSKISQFAENLTASGQPMLSKAQIGEIKDVIRTEGDPRAQQLPAQMGPYNRSIQLTAKPVIDRYNALAHGSPAGNGQSKGGMTAADQAALDQLFPPKKK